MKILFLKVKLWLLLLAFPFGEYDFSLDFYKDLLVTVYGFNKFDYKFDGCYSIDYISKTFGVYNLETANADYFYLGVTHDIGDDDLFVY